MGFLRIFAQAPELPISVKPAVGPTKSVVGPTKSVGKPVGDTKQEETTEGKSEENSDDMGEAAPVENTSNSQRESNTEPMSPVAAERPEWDTQESFLNTSMTGMSNTGVAFAADAAGERCAIEGNVAMGLAQSALKDEVLERLGGTKEILSGLIFVLNTGTEWAAAASARAIANIAYRTENLLSFVSLLDEVQRDKLISGLALLANDKMRPKSKEYAALCIANMLANDTLLMGFQKVQGLKEDLALLQKNPDPLISLEATRAVTIMNQARFGTISWRAPKRS